jgi:hypothetical protein
MASPAKVPLGETQKWNCEKQVRRFFTKVLAAIIGGDPKMVYSQQFLQTPLFYAEFSKVDCLRVRFTILILVPVVETGGDE